MKKMVLVIVVLAAALALATAQAGLAESDKTDNEAVSSQGTSGEHMHPGKSWKHGRKMGAAKRVKSHFDYLDANTDGKITHEEFMAPHERRFKDADADGNGYLTKEEFGKSWARMRKKIREKRHKGAQ